MDKAQDGTLLVDELPDVPAPEAGYGNRELMVIDDLFQPDMPDGKLVNLYFLVHDWYHRDEATFADAFRQVEDSLLGRMSGGVIDANMERDLPGFEPEDVNAATEAVCSGSLSHWQVLEMYALAASERGNEDDKDLGQRWQAVMDLCRCQILRRIKDASVREQRRKPENLISTIGVLGSSGDDDLPVGYRIGDFEKVQSALGSNLANDRVMGVLLYAAEQSSGCERSPLPHHDWQNLRDEAGNLLMKRMAGTGRAAPEGNWYDFKADWNDRKLRLAQKVIPDLNDGDLLTLFLHAAENAYYNETTPRQARWEAVTAGCREEIVRRTNAALTRHGSMDVDSYDAGEEAEVDDGEHLEDDAELISERAALRIAEEALHPDMSDAKLLEAYVLAQECNGIENEVWDEIADTYREMVFTRMRRGAPDPHFERSVEGFDYPDHRLQALEAVMKGDLPHKNLLVLYRLAWDHSRRDETWTAIFDLCRAQILRRMTPASERGGIHWEDWRRLELTRRALACVT